MYAAVIEPFSLVWWKGSITLLVIGTSILMATLVLPEKWREQFSKYLGIFLLFDICFFEVALYSMGSWSIDWALPLQYCTIMEFCSALALITKWQWAYELVLFLGMIGPIQALISPAFPYPGDYFFYDFYISHAAPIFVPFYLTFAEKMRPRPHAWWKSGLSFAFFSFFIFLFDYQTGANYMFLMQKPPLDHPFIQMGTWPNYLLLWFLVLMTWSGIMNLFFWIPKRLQRIWYTEYSV